MPWSSQWARRPYPSWIWGGGGVNYNPPDLMQMQYLFAFNCWLSLRERLDRLLGQVVWYWAYLLHLTDWFLSRRGGTQQHLVGSSQKGVCRQDWVRSPKLLRSFNATHKCRNFSHHLTQLKYEVARGSQYWLLFCLQAITILVQFLH